MVLGDGAMTPNFIRQPSASGISDHPPPAFAKADRDIAVAAGGGAEDRFIAVFEKGAGLTRRQFVEFLAVLAQFAEAAPARRRRAGDRAGAEQVARLDV